MRADMTRRVFLSVSATIAGMVLWPGNSKAAEEAQSLLPEDALRAFTLLAGEPLPEVEVIALPEGERFAEALRARVVAPPINQYEEGESEIWVAGRTTGAITKGDILKLTFWARGVQMADGRAELFIKLLEPYGGPYVIWSRRSLTFGSEWTEFTFVFAAGEAYLPEGGQVRFFPGYEPQSIEIANIQFLNYGQIPLPPPTYPGRESGAHWREVAERRIQHVRRAHLTVEVEDGAGKPLPDALVHVKMQRHEFGFGSAIQANVLLDTKPDSEIYRSTIERLFNRVVFANDLKWPQWEMPVWRERMWRALAWVEERKKEIRGHTLIWPAWKFLPPDLYDLRSDPTAMRARVDQHILEEVAAMRGHLIEWDVVNEPYRHHVVMDTLGLEELARWFKLARQADPDVQLYLNDIGVIEDGGSWRERHQDFLYNLVRSLQDNGAPIGGLGLQGHYNSEGEDPEYILAALDRFAELGLPMQVTEFDVNTLDDQFAADFTRDMMILLYSHPAVEGFMQWGFWAGAHWRPDAAMFRRDWSVRPHGQVFQDLVFKEWWTDTSGRTNRRGRYRIQGFRGVYQIEVTVNGKLQTVEATLPKQGNRIKVTIE